MKIYGYINKYRFLILFCVCKSELLQMNSIVIDDHLVVKLQVPLLDKSPIMNVYKVNNLPILHSVLQKAFQYFLEEECHALFSDGYSATIPSEHHMLTCVFPV